MTQQNRLYAIRKLLRSGKSEEEIDEMAEELELNGFSEEEIGGVIDAMRRSYENRDPEVIQKITGISQATFYRDLAKIREMEIKEENATI